MSAHQRVVDDAAIDEAIGLKALADAEVYVGCVYGDYLDRHVNAERTAFTFNTDENRAIRRALIDSAMVYLGSNVANMKERKQKVALKVIEEYPQFLYLHSELRPAAAAPARDTLHFALMTGNRTACAFLTCLCTWVGDSRKVAPRPDRIGASPGIR
jgi:hypothetical protein